MARARIAAELAYWIGRTVSFDREDRRLSGQVLGARFIKGASADWVCLRVLGANGFLYPGVPAMATADPTRSEQCRRCYGAGWVIIPVNRGKVIDIRKPCPVCFGTGKREVKAGT